MTLSPSVYDGGKKGKGRVEIGGGGDSPTIGKGKECLDFLLGTLID